MIDKEISLLSNVTKISYVTKTIKIFSLLFLLERQIYFFIQSFRHIHINQNIS